MNSAGKNKRKSSEVNEAADQGEYEVALKAKPVKHLVKKQLEFIEEEINEVKHIEPDIFERNFGTERDFEKSLSKAIPDEDTRKSLQKLWKGLRYSYLGRNFKSDSVRLEKSGYRILSTGCLLSNGTNSDARKKYISVPLSTRQDWAYAHKISYCISKLSLEMLDSQEYQVSHLCHNAKCVNPKHLAKETQMENLDRNKCQGWTWIWSPSGDFFNPCQHKPQCILPKPE